LHIRGTVGGASAATDRLSGFVGYRALGVNYKSDGFIYDVVQHGPLVGVSLRF
jgi:hypothetical protein